MQATQQASNRLADRTAARVMALWAMYVAGDLTLGAFRRQATSSVAAANVAGVQLADLGVAAEVARQLRTLSRPLGLRPTNVQVDQDRIARDVDRIMDRTPEPAGELGVWARSEPLLTVATAIQTAMVSRGVSGWTRQLSGASCPLCVGWADGVVRPAHISMARHPGCDCVQAPVF